MKTSFLRGGRRRLVAMLLASTPLVAQAAPPAASASALQDAKAHFERGVKLYEEEDHRAALIEFTRAYERAPNWQVLFNIGHAHYQLRDYAEALETLERYLAEGGDKVQGERRAQVSREIDELRGRVAHVVILSNVAGADVAIDERTFGTTPLTGPLRLGAGRHRATLSKAGYAPATRVFDLAGGDAAEITLNLAEPARTPNAAAKAADVGAVEEARGHGAAITSFAIAGAGLAVGTVFGVLAMGDKRRLDAACVGKVCPMAHQRDIDAYSRDGLLSTVGFTVGVGAAAVGAALLLARGHEPPKVTPWVGAGSAGLRGTF